MPAAKYSDEFKTQVVREVIEKDRTIASVAASYDLVAQTVGNWVARYRKEHATDQDRKKASESAEIAKLRAENRELRQENEWTAGCFSDSACFVLQAAFFRPKNSLSTSFGVRYPRAE